MMIQPIDYVLVVWFALAAASTAYVPTISSAIIRSPR
jgi:hypothetical protein